MTERKTSRDTSDVPEFIWLICPVCKRTTFAPLGTFCQFDEVDLVAIGPQETLDAAHIPQTQHKPTELERARILDFAFDGVRDGNIGPREARLRASGSGEDDR